MENQEERRYVKRTQKDYTISFKLQIVQWLRKFGNFDWDNQTPSNMPKSPE
jgi:transposase